LGFIRDGGSVREEGSYERSWRELCVEHGLTKQAKPTDQAKPKMSREEFLRQDESHPQFKLVKDEPGKGFLIVGAKSPRPRRIDQ
jgi:hypothetical protein